MDVNGVSTVEMIEFSEDLRIHRHLIVKIVRLPNIKDFFLSPSKVLLCRSETLLTVEPSMKLFTRSASAKSEQIDDDY